MPTIEMEMIRPIDEFGPALAGRADAARLRQRIVDAAQAGVHVVVDLDGVLMSPSFADELFGKMPQALVADGSVVFQNIDDDLSVLASFVVDARSH